MAIVDIATATPRQPHHDHSPSSVHGALYMLISAPGKNISHQQNIFSPRLASPCPLFLLAFSLFAVAASAHVALSPPSRLLTSLECPESEYSSVICKRYGDLSNSSQKELCTFCNIYISHQGRILYRDVPSSRTALNAPPSFQQTVIDWRPTTVFSPYRLTISPMLSNTTIHAHPQIVRNISSITLYVIPRLEVSKKVKLCAF